MDQYTIRKTGGLIMINVEALENIKNTWENNAISLADKIDTISSDFYSSGLDLLSTASFIKATPSELQALLSLGELDDETVARISWVNPPKTTWIMLANANHEEIDEAIRIMEKEKHLKPLFSDVVYNSMIDVSGPTQEQKVNLLSAKEIKKIREKGETYKAFYDKEIKFLKSIAGQKGKGKELTRKQIHWFISILEKLVDANAISKNSLDDDQELCNKVLDILEK